MSSIVVIGRGDNESAKAAYVQKLKENAATQDLSQDLRPATRNLSIIFTVLAAVFVGLRFLARKRQAAKYGTDDWLILVALVFMFGNFIFNIVLINQGVGLHSGALTLAELEKLDEIIVGAEIIYVTGVNMYKISLLFLYYRVFPLPSIRLGSYICGGLSTAWTLACIFAASFQCTPREKIWQPWVSGTCINLFLTQLCISIPSILCDIAILMLPIPHVWRLKTNLTQRVFITGIFLLGSYVVFTSCYRFVVYLSYSRDDVPYTLAMPIAWNVIEISSGIVSACLPTLAPLVRLVFTSLTPSSVARSKGLSNGGSRPIQTIGGSGQASGPRSWGKLGGSDSGTDRNFRLGTPQTEYGVNVAITYNRDAKNSSTEEIPLRGIREDTLVEWHVERMPNEDGGVK